ncbi:putative membrane protein [Pedobacter sp. UYEF25]
MAKTPTLSRFHKLTALPILLICLTIGLIFYLGGFFFKLNGLSQIMFAWDAFSVALIATHWSMFFSVDAARTKLRAQMQDENRSEIFLVILVATFAALFAVILVLIDKELKPTDISIAIIGLFLSWCLVHTTFTLRYARLYYQNNNESSDKKSGVGLNFPGDDEPDFLDFAYYSFVIGMTFQVSDVEISSKKMRRLTLLHSLLSFVFNTIIVALTINVLAGLGGK